MRALAAFVLALLPGMAVADCTAPANLAQLRTDMAKAVNAQRNANGRVPLGHAPRLDEAAMAHACWMAETGTFSHRGAGGSLPKRRIRATGYRTHLTAENIAWGQRTAAQVVAEWMQSPGHRKNILLGGIDEYGIGIAVMQGRLVWVMDYAAH
ncbi:CAP domain-containing protein [Sinisalibacter aestuarii]|uniref:SCP domain-containing protein n=1 Tax=Sinisalibacter aestuarii TaxID=2949426 RepID=A0ABQ5LPT5_9RHOB|nr:CAP domain-containing protein [Sinisalibacter aestuarii]GKY87020.1 hypothetical protein STA1M1_08890 [Sinisalibacter aestuarii]